MSKAKVTFIGLSAQDQQTVKRAAEQGSNASAVLLASAKANKVKNLVSFKAWKKQVRLQLKLKDEQADVLKTLLSRVGKKLKISGEPNGKGFPPKVEAYNGKRGDKADGLKYINEQLVKLLEYIGLSESSVKVVAVK